MDTAHPDRTRSFVDKSFFPGGGTREGRELKADLTHPTLRALQRLLGAKASEMGAAKPPEGVLINDNGIPTITHLAWFRNGIDGKTGKTYVEVDGKRVFLVQTNKGWVPEDAFPESTGENKRGMSDSPPPGGPPPSFADKVFLDPRTRRPVVR